MERAIEIFTALSLVIVGLSHMLQPRAWVAFFLALREKGDTGVFLVAYMHLPIGLLIVAFHPVWTGFPLIITLLGCAWTLKGALYLCFPAIGRRSLSMVSMEKARHFVVAGAALFVLGAVVLATLIAGEPNP